jgi:hypothetical protein
VIRPVPKPCIAETGRREHEERIRGIDEVAFLVVVHRLIRAAELLSNDRKDEPGIIPARRRDERHVLVVVALGLIGRPQGIRLAELK